MIPYILMYIFGLFLFTILGVLAISYIKDESIDEFFERFRRAILWDLIIIILVIIIYCVTYLIINKILTVYG